LKDEIKELLEDRKIISEVNLLKKRIDNLISQVNNLKKEEASSNFKAHFDMSKILEVVEFENYQKTVTKDLSKLEDKIDEQKRAIDNIIDELKNRPTIRDNKNLEEFLLTKIDELKINCSKRFADKIDTHKNVKYLDTQVFLLK